MTRELHLLVPGSLQQRTGGYLYDARMVKELRVRGRTVRVHELEGRFPEADATARASFEAALAGIPDGGLVVADGLAMGGLPGPVSGHAGRVALVALVHHPLAEETGLDAGARDRLRRLESEALTHVRGVVVTSGFTARRIRAWGVDPGRVRVVLPGTDRPPPPPDGNRGPNASPLLLSVGSVTPRKGQDVLVQALADIRDLPWRCVVCGSLERDPSFARKVAGLVEELGLRDRIRLAGELDEEALQAWYRAGDVFVLPSHYEGYGMVLAEALVHGLPVVSTTGGAIPDTVPPDAGILVEPGDARALCAALRTLLREPERRAAHAAAARRHGASLPSWETQAAVFEAALTELAGHD